MSWFRSYPIKGQTFSFISNKLSNLVIHIQQIDQHCHWLLFWFISNKESNLVINYVLIHIQLCPHSNFVIHIQQTVQPCHWLCLGSYPITVQPCHWLLYQWGLSQWHVMYCLHSRATQCAVSSDLNISLFHTSTRQSWDSLAGVKLSQTLSGQRWREKIPIKLALFADQAKASSPWLFDFFIKHHQTAQYSISSEYIFIWYAHTKSGFMFAKTQGRAIMHHITLPRYRAMQGALNKLVKTKSSGRHRLLSSWGG